MEFWLGLSTDLVGCSEDDSRRKEKKIGGEEHMIGEEREGGRATETGDDDVLCRDWRREITTH